MEKILRSDRDYLGLVETDSSSPAMATRLTTIMEGQEPRPSQLPLGHLPPQRTTSQERFKQRHPGTPSAYSPHTISATTPTDMPSFIQNLSEEDYNKMPREVKHYIQERAHRIVSEIVPESSQDVDSIASRLSARQTPQEEQTYPFPGGPKQRTLYPLATDHLEVGHDGYYLEIRNYNRVEQLGEGGFGMVYACQDNCRESLFAIKCNNQSTPEKVQAMMKECHVLHSLGQHTNITRFMGSLVDDYGTEFPGGGESWKMLMECAINGDLNEMLFDPDKEEWSGLPLDQSLYYLRQILQAVDYLHQRNTLHLDLKCRNVLVFDEGKTVKLTDFGSALRKEDIELKGSLAGFTPNYSAPEVISGVDVPSYSADVWSTMCVLVEMLTGKMPWCYFQDLEQQMIIMMVGNYDESERFDTLVPLAKLGLPKAVEEILRCVLKKDSKKRLSANELLRNPVIEEAAQYVRFFESSYDPEAVEDEQSSLSILQPISDTDMTTNAQSSAYPGNQQRISVDSGMGRSDTDSGLYVATSPTTLSPLSSNESRFPSMLNNTSRYQIFRHESAPNFSLPASNNLFARFEEITAHFNSPQNNTITTTGGLLHSCSAPADMYSDHLHRHRLVPRGDDDVEKDGVSHGLKRTTSEQYVSQGPEVDSPDGRRIAVTSNATKTPFIPSPTSNGMVSIGTQTSSSPTIEVRPPFPGPQTITTYRGSQTTSILLL